MPIKPEIMSPAGYFPQLHAAIEAGADSVYFGLKHFSARAKVGFTLDELPDAIQALHSRGVKGYVTFNTLIFENELQDAVNTIEAIAKAGTDAVIVQDIGITRLIHDIAPDLEIHGSTQMSITSAEGVNLAQQLGVTRVVLARELSLKDIRAVREMTNCELEVFVHGALCVSYSGQCFSSEAWGGRSANRGQCAQACRLPYDLIVDDEFVPLGDKRYLLSPGDLYALHQVPELMDIGIHALKIEGRYKDADYVALTTNAYRRTVDAAWQNQPNPINQTEEIQLEQAYSRGLGAHFISGTNHQSVVDGRSPRHRGVFVGQVNRVLSDRVLIQPTERVQSTSPIKAGDGLVFDAADWRSPEVNEEGGHVYAVKQAGNMLELAFGNQAIDFSRIRTGDLVWRSYDADTAKAAKHFTQASNPVQKQALNVHVTAIEGEQLSLHWQLVKHPDIQTTIYSDQPLDRANNLTPTIDYLQRQLGRLGNTSYDLHTIRTDIQGQPFIPSSLLNQMRQRAVEDLQQQQAIAQSVTTHEPSHVLNNALKSIRHQQPDVSDTVSLHLLVRTPEQLEAALELRPASITLDYLELYGLSPAVKQIKDAGIVARVASPRILKPHEQSVVNFLLRLDCALLVRSSGLLDALQGRHQHSLIGDFSLNIANQLAADAFFKLGIETITPTHDLNADQIMQLAQDVGGDHCEVIAYHHLPVFHTEHCVFCRFMSDGTSKENCGQPCERHRVALRDVKGREHPVMADVGCRNTVFGAEAQVASAYLGQMIDSGIHHFRLEFVHETARDVRRITSAFQDYFASQIDTRELDRRLAKIAPQGTSEGSFFVPADTIQISSIL